MTAHQCYPQWAPDPPSNWCKIIWAMLCGGIGARGLVEEAVPNNALSVKKRIKLGELITNTRKSVKHLVVTASSATNPQAPMMDWGEESTGCAA